MRKITLIKTIFWSIISVGLTRQTFALQGEQDLKNPLGGIDSFAELVNAIANIVFKIGVPVAVIFIIYSGFLFVSAKGNAEQLKSAKSTFFWAVIGTAVLLGAKIIATVIETTIKGLK
jgi:hypothetical protein